MFLNFLELKKISSLKKIVLKNSEFSCEIENVKILGYAFLGGNISSCTKPDKIGSTVLFSNLSDDDSFQVVNMDKGSAFTLSLAQFGRDGIFLTTGEKLAESVPRIKNTTLASDKLVKIDIDTLVEDIQLSIQVKEDQLIVFSSKEKEPVVIIDIDSEESSAKLTKLKPVVSNSVCFQLKNCFVSIILDDNKTLLEVVENVNGKMEHIDKVNIYYDQLLAIA